ncbi:MAG TPA: LysM peptidoglycan-binding domain-containing protein [Clostridiales bacterium]|nr:LysM peptidoglycan-binding domain-containing protein [Clostridiales bacterium]
MKRILSMLLALSMVFSILPITAMAEEAEIPYDIPTDVPVEVSQETITAFAPLEETEITVAPGTFLEDLDLPKTLTVTVQTSASDEGEPAAESGGAGEDTSTPDEASEEPADNAVNTSEDTSVPDEASEAPADDTESSDEDTSAPDEVSEEPTEQDTPSNDEEASDRREETGKTTRAIPVTWTSQPEYDANAEGEYFFTPVIEGYTVSVELPQIKATVKPTLTPAALGMLLGASGSTVSVSTAAELMAAISDIATNGTIYLTDDITLTETVTVSSTKSSSFTLDLNEHTLNGGTNTCIQHKGSGILTIQNGNVIANTSSPSSAAIQLNSSSGLMLKDVMVENSNGYGIIANSSGNVTIQGGKVKAGSNAAISMGGQGNLDVSGAIIEGASNGIVTGSAATISTVTIGGGAYIRSYNTSNGAITLSSKNTALILKGCTIYSEGYYTVSFGPGSKEIFKIQGESPVVLQGKGVRAVFHVPDLSGYTGIIRASTNVDGSQSQVISTEVLNNNNNAYKYLAFTPGNPNIRNATTNAFYDNLQSAVDEVRAGETIELLDDLTLAETMEIPAGDSRSFILDLNNHTLDGGSSTSIRHNGGGTLTIANGIRATAQTGTIKGGIDGTGRVVIAGPVVIQGAPAFNNDNLVLDDVIVVKASTSPDGSTSAPYDESQLSSYRYLEFGFSFHAKIGDTGYSLLEDAVAAVQEGETIVLLENITLDQQITFDKNYDITLDLNGKTIELDKWQSAPILYAGPGKLTIDSSLDGGKIQSNAMASHVIQIKCDTGNLTIRNCILESVYGIHFNAPKGFGNLDVINCTINAKYGIYLTDSGKQYNIGTINITNSKIIGPGSSITDSHGIYHSSVTMEGIHISDSTISGFTNGIAGDYGGNTVTVSGHTVIQGIDSNLSQVLKKVNLQLNGVKVVKASRRYDGSLPEAYDETKYSYYKYLEFDTAVAKIGSTYFKTLQAAIDRVSFRETIDLLEDITLTDTVEIPNTKIADFTLNLNGYKLEGNSTVINHNGSGVLTINGGGGQIIAQSGSGVAVSNGSLSVNGVAINSQTGPGIYFWAPSKYGNLTVTNCNVNGDIDGIYYNSNGTVTISGGSVSHTSTSYGGAIEIDKGKINILGGCEIVGCFGILGPNSGAIPSVNISDGTIRALLSAIWNCDATISGSATLQANRAGSNFSIFANGTLTLQDVLVVKASMNSDGTLPDDPFDAERLTKYQYVEFAPIPTYTITYDANGGGGSMTAGTAREGESFQLPTNGFTPPAGKRFVAWAIGSPSGTQRSAGESHTFDADTTVYAVWEDIPTYTITYDANGGTASMTAGTAYEGESFQLPENGFTPPAGKRFVAWAIGSPSGTQRSAGESYTFDADTTLYAVWEHITHTITATAGAGGNITPSGNVTVNSGDSKTFTITPNSNYSIADVKVDDVSQGKITTYTFENITANHTISVTFSYNGGSGGGSSGGDRSRDDDDSSSGGSSGGSSNAAPLAVADEPNAPTQGQVNVSGTVDSNGNLFVNVTSQAVTNALNQALAEAKKNGNQENRVAVVIRVKAGGNSIGSRVTVNLPKAVQETIIEKQIVHTIIVVDNPDIQVGLDLATVKEINRQAQSDVRITATRRSNSTLSGDARNIIGNRPAFDLSVSYGNSRQVQNFSNGTVTLTIPYTLGASESAGNLMAVYVDGNGKVHWLINSVYDSKAKVLRFSTNHFSTYGVGYKQNTTFTDLATHWAKDDIEFAISRGLLCGTTATTFGPNSAITRGALVTALGRLADVNVSSYKQSSFADVKQGSYYLGYVEWANKNNILKSSNGKFTPDQGVTREQLAAILQSYAKATGFTLPKVQVENTFADNGNISASSRNAVKQVQMAGIMSGKQNNRFDPKGIVTRAEFAAVLRRLVERKLSGEAMQGWEKNDAGQWMYYQNGKPVTGKKVIGGKTYTFDQYGVTADEPKKAKAGTSSGTYTVQPGDSFWLIAKQVGCTMEELEQLNGKKRTDLIHPGDIFQVPEK